MLSRRSKALLAVSAAAALFGCGSQAGPYDAQVAQGRAAWAATEAACADVYHYSVVGSSFSGASWRTTIVIEHGQPTVRFYTMSNSTMVVTQWSETPPDIGSHAEGAPALTMEQLYDQCAHDVLSQDPAKNFITFQVNADGSIAECSYFPKGCTDDCGVGVSIREVGCGAARPQ